MTNHPYLKKWLLRSGIVCGCIVLLVLAAAGTHYLIAQQKLKSVCAHMREDSIPLTWEELYELFPNFEAHLAAQPQFFAALDQLEDVTRQSWEENNDGLQIYPPRLASEFRPPKSDCGPVNPPADIEKLEDHLHYVYPALEDIREAVAAEPFWLIPPEKNTFDSPSMSGFIPLRNAARLFSIEAVLHAEHNEPQAATQTVIDGIRFAEVPHRGSLLIDEMVRFSCEGIALHSLEYVLAKTDPSSESLLELQALLSTHSDMRTGILGEIIIMKQGFAVMADISRIDLEGYVDTDQDDLTPWHNMLMYLPILPGWMRMNEAYNLELLHRIIDNWSLPWQESTNKFEQNLDVIPWLYFLPAIYTPSFSQFKKTELRTAGAWSCGRIAVAIEMYSQEHDVLPATLAELVPEYLEGIPTEPFYGKPFGYETDDNAGTLSFSIPERKRDYTFKVFANRESIKIKN
jgi:hypothetical protein